MLLSRLLLLNNYSIYLNFYISIHLGRTDHLLFSRLEYLIYHELMFNID